MLATATRLCSAAPAPPARGQMSSRYGCRMRMVDVSDALGCEVVDVDLHEPLTPAAVDALRDAFDSRHLLLFRDQRLTGEEQAEFVEHFGPVAGERQGRFGHVSNVVDGGVVPEGALPYHSD